MDITDPHQVRSAFATTYSKSDEEHPLQAFERYNLVMKHLEEQPEIGAWKLSDRLGLSPWLIRGWQDGSKPTGYEATQTAAENGWFDLSWSGEQFRALNELVAWNLSGGNVNESYAPAFYIDQTATDDAVGTVQTLLEDAGMEETAVDRVDTDDRATTIRPTVDPILFGRWLVAVGVPRGSKSSQRFGLPPYLSRAPDDVRSAFARRYILNRGSERPGHSEHVLVLKENRDRFYLDSLAALFRSLVDSYDQEVVQRYEESVVVYQPILDGLNMTLE